VIVWTEAEAATLRKLWSEGMSAGQISLKMGFSRNAVIGKARRLDLPARPSPIRPRPQ
jgi:GcrA cell cycle regulator